MGLAGRAASGRAASSAPDGCATRAWILLQRLPQVWCEPFADASQLPTLLASELLGARKPVALTGDGGDELFFGPPQLWPRAAQCTPVRWPAGLGA
ncbi:MAG: asparagine synthase-related protein [Stenotrophomonas maltophilia]